MTQVNPFGNLSKVIDSLNIEQSDSVVTIHGNADIHRNKQGLETARRLKREIDALVEYLSDEKNHIDCSILPKVMIQNPFE